MSNSLFSHTYFLHCPFWEGLFIQLMSAAWKTASSLPQNSMSTFQSARRHENIHKQRTNVPGNKPHNFWINSSLKTSISGDSRNIRCLASMVPIFCWHLKEITSIESLALGLGKTDCELFCPIHKKAWRCKDFKGSLSPNAGSALPHVLYHQLERKVMAYTGHILPSCSSGDAGGLDS